jgi:hypothetical protein
MKPARLASLIVAVAFFGALDPAFSADPPAKALAGKPRAAEETKHWAFQAIKRPALPTVATTGWVRTPIDSFILARLEKAGITPAEDADRRTLLRRAYLDVIGLPPSPAELDTFLMDKAPDAFARAVDHLLASRQYGERWARHWLDVARYAETNGYERDGPKPNAWRYRDYVIDSLNADKPFDRFLTEQLAGDELPKTSAQSQIATTFMRLGTWDDEPAEPVLDRFDQLDDVLGTAAAAFLAQTLRCARCHDHKFEPFTQVDYYRMLAVFMPLKRPQKDRADLDRLVGTDKELASYRDSKAQLDREIARLQKRIDTTKEMLRKRLLDSQAAEAGWLTGPAKPIVPPEALAAIQKPAGKRATQDIQLAARYGPVFEEAALARAVPEERKQLSGWQQETQTRRNRMPKEPPRAYIWYEDSPKAPETHVLRRGDPTRPTKVVEPGVPEIMTNRQPPPPTPLPHSTGRRLWLAHWLTSQENPLVARVIVNRMWQHHFGDGLVSSESDFGTMGQAPSHPELLDWLASELVAGGWHMKPIHRMILLSHAYQLDSTPSSPAILKDPEGRLLWRWRQRRLEAEAMRDSLLAVSGQLNLQGSGPSVFPPLARAVLEGQSRPGEGWGKSEPRQAARRSIYIFSKRNLSVPELELLDAPDTTSSCEKRPVSTTGPQALTFFNGEFLHQQATLLAARLRKEAGEKPADQVRLAFVLALARSPAPEELSASLDFLTNQERQVAKDRKPGIKVAEPASAKALAAFCLVLLNTNEFAYVN